MANDSEDFEVEFAVFSDLENNDDVNGEDVNEW